MVHAYIVTSKPFQGSTKRFTCIAHSPNYWDTLPVLLRVKRSNKIYSCRELKKCKTLRIYARTITEMHWFCVPHHLLNSCRWATSRSRSFFLAARSREIWVGSRRIPMQPSTWYLGIWCKTVFTEMSQKCISRSDPLTGYYSHSPLKTMGELQWYLRKPPERGPRSIPWSHLTLTCVMLVGTKAEGKWRGVVHQVVRRGRKKRRQRKEKW